MKTHTPLHRLFEKRNLSVAQPMVVLFRSFHENRMAMRMLVYMIFVG